MTRNATAMSRRDVLLGLATGATLVVGGALGKPALAARPRVDLALLLAIDASASITRGILDFQLRGHAAAFRDVSVAQGVAAGRHGAVAVALAQFAGPESFATLLPWTRLASGADCQAFAQRIDGLPGVAMGGSTALGSGIVQAVRRLDEAPFEAEKRTIDLVSNGFNNAGIDPRSAGAHAAAAGVTVNALAILDEYDWLEEYYRDTVVAGDGAFVKACDGPDSFTNAFRAKLIAEIA